MFQQVPTIANGGRKPNGTLASATNTITAPTKLIKHVKIDETIAVPKKKTWPHKSITFTITLLIGLAVGIAISIFLFWLPFGGPREDVGHTGELIGWSFVIIVGATGSLWLILWFIQRATNEYKD